MATQFKVYFGCNLGVPLIDDPPAQANGNPEGGNPGDDADAGPELVSGYY